MAMSRTITRRHWLRLLQRYTQTRARRSGPVTPEEACNQKLQRLCNRGELEAAMTAFQDMVDRGYTPSQVSLGRLAHLCQSSGDMERFEGVAKYIESVGVELDESVGNPLIHGLVQAGQSNRARNVFREMIKVGARIRVGVVNSLLEAELREREMSASVTLLQLLASMGSSPQVPVSVRAIQVATELGAKGDTLAESLMELYRSTEQVMEHQVADELSTWLRQHYTVSEATVDSSGVCSCCGTCLEDNGLSPSQHQWLLQYADQQLDTEADSFANNRPELAEVKHFKTSLHRNRGFSAVLDGLNAAHVYCKKPNIKQMLHIASTARDELGGPVLIISRRHLARRILPGKTASQVEINRLFWPQGIQFFFTQNRVADDHYFLYGSLASGNRTYFVSNDKLGDHTAHSVPPALVPVFRGWQRSRQVTIEIAPHLGSRRGIPLLTLKKPRTYRVVLQWSGDMKQCHVPASRDSVDSVQWLCITKA